MPKASFISKVENRFTDASGAERFAKMFGNVARFCPETGTWLYWTGKMWQIDDANIIRDTCGVKWAQSYSEDADEATDEKAQGALREYSKRCESRRKLNDTLDMAKAKCIIRKNELDLGLWLFNVQNGTIDLRTGDLLEHDPQNYITKVAPVEYAVDSNLKEDAPRWHKFIWDVVCQRSDLLEYIQKMLGSALVGRILDRHLYIFYGASGFNGKTTLIEIIKEIMGTDYTSELPRAVIESNKYSSGGVTPELAKMDGARFVTVSETKDMYRLAVDLVKQLVGGGRILVNPKYGKPFSFIPQATICIETNRLPSVDGTDKALWARLCPIPFDYEVPGEKVNLYLKDEILDIEAPVVLKWMVEGARKWATDGMAMPKSVWDTYSAYHQESDPVGLFLESECVTIAEGNVARTQVLYKMYERWAKSTGSPEMQVRTFVNRMSSPLRVIRGISLERVASIVGQMGGGWSGVSVNEFGGPYGVPSGYTQGDSDDNDGMNDVL